jgi:hypothetical protein
MPLQKILFKPGVNRENTRYTTEGGWYECDKIRFRQGNPEKIGGWNRFSPNTFIGLCRSLWNWITLAFLNLIGVGTNRKFYILSGGLYNDITPIRSTVTLTNPFQAAYSTLNGGISDTATSLTLTSATNFARRGILRIDSEDIQYTNKVGNVLSGLVRGYNGTTAAAHSNGAGVGSYTITVTDNDNEALDGDFVTFSGSGITGLGGNITATVLKNEFQITFIDENTYTINASTYANASDTGNGGTVVTQYQLNTGDDIEIPLTGWGAGAWGAGTWGIGGTTTYSFLLWNQFNFGQDLIYGQRGGPLYYWNASIGFTPVIFTVTIASPAVVTAPDLVLIDDTAVMFNTTSALPTGLSVGVVYFVIRDPAITYADDEFSLATTRGDITTIVNTSGSQSGTHTISPRGIPLTSLGDAFTPLYQNYLIISDASRFVLVFGTNDYGSTTIDPMLIRWSAQEDPFTWEPLATNQAGSLKLSHGSKIVTAIQTRQEIVVFTDSSLYSLQYLGPPFVWQSQLLGDNVSIIGPNAGTIASGVVYWMGVDKFYAYDGRVQTLNCDLRRYVFSDFNQFQTEQIFAGTNEGFNEVWWFYCSKNSNTIDRYVIYNYLERIWYYGTMARTAWLDSGLLPYPLAATYSNNIVQHEVGVDDVESGTAVPIQANISSSEFDLGEGHNFGYIWRVLPDLTFTGSEPTGKVDNGVVYPTPQVTMTLYPLQNSGSGTGYPASSGVVKGANYNITEEYTGQIYTRVRGRQMIFKISSDQVGTTWQLGAPRIDIRPDGRR